MMFLGPIEISKKVESRQDRWEEQFLQYEYE